MKIQGAIKNGQSRDLGNIGHTTQTEGKQSTEDLTDNYSITFLTERKTV